MNRYQKDEFGTISIFVEWKAKFCEYCRNWFEEENGCTYLQNTLKKGNISFQEYFKLYSQKKNKFQIKWISLIEVMKENVNYFAQSSAFH